jgi:adenylate cyclase
MSKTARTTLVVGCAFLLAWSLALLAPGFFDIVGLRILDAQFRLRYRLLGRQPIDPSVAHVDIDDASLQDLPDTMDRAELVASALDVLASCEVSAVVLDMVFLQQESSPGSRRLVRAIGDAGVVYCPVVLRPASMKAPQPTQAREARARSAQVPPQAIWGLASGGRGLDIPSAGAGFSSSSALLAAARGVGHINSFPDPDGIYRRIPLLLRVPGGYVPSLALRTVCGYLGVSEDRVEVEGGRRILLRGAQYPDGRRRDIRIPVDRGGRLLLNIAGPWADSFPHYPIARLVEAGGDEGLMSDLRDEMEGDLVVLSDVSSGGKDYGPVALEEYYPLSGLHANAVSSLLRGEFLVPPSTAARVVATVMLAALLFLLALRLRGAGFLVVAAGVLALFLAATAALFLFLRVVVDIALPALGTLFAAAAVSASTFLDQEREKAAFRARIEHYFSPPLLKKILDRPLLLEGCEKKVLTVLFSDISGFTTWSSRQAPEDIRRMLNEYFEEMAGVVFSFEGTIDKYIGDGMLAFFGDPVEQRDHAERAVRAAIGMQRKVAELRGRWEPAGGMAIAIRVGINTGEVVAGNMGSAQRLDYTVIGSNVNLASRLESGARPGQVLVSRATCEALPPSIPVRPAGTISAKGFSEPIEVFTVDVAPP